MAEPRHAFGPFVLDPAGDSLRRDGHPVVLGQRGLALLKALLDADGAAVSKDELLAAGWPGLIVEEANLSVQIAALRKALGKAPDGQEWIATVPRLGYRLPRPGIAAPAAEPARLSVAVLPFESLSADRDDAYFADGVVEDIITALSRFRSFAVVARTAAIAYRGESSDVREAGKALGVRYVLNGSVRRRGEQLRVTVRLLDCDSGANLWAEQFDGALADLFAFQDRITDEVVGLAEPEVRKAEIQRARRKPPANLDAYDLYLRALPHFRGTTPEVRTEAIRLLEQAIALDPGFAIALVHAAWAYERQDTFGSGATRFEHDRALELAELALQHGHEDPLVVAIAALVLQNIGHQTQRSLAMLRQAYDANPNNSTVLSLCAFLNVMSGDLEFGRQCYRRALHVAPGALDNYEILVGLGIADLFSGNYESAIDWSMQSLAANPDWIGAYWTLAPAQAHLGRMAEAGQTIAGLLRLAPHMRMSDIERIGERHPGRFQAVIDGLRKAGLPA